MQIAVWQIALVTLVAFCYGLDRAPQFNPGNVFYGWIVGLIMGDPLLGLQLGATLTLMSLGVAGLGGASVPDYGLATIIGTSVAIASGQDQSVGLAAGIAVGMLGVQLDVIVKILNGFVSRKSQAYAAAGNYTAMSRILFLGPLFFALSTSIPTLIMLVFGTEAVNLILNVLPAWVTSGLSIAGGILPCIGMALLLSFMPTKKFFSFVLIGYVLSAYLNLAVLPVAILGAAAAYEHYKAQSEKTAAATTVKGALEDE